MLVLITLVVFAAISAYLCAFVVVIAPVYLYALSAKRLLEDIRKSNLATPELDEITDNEESLIKECKCVATSSNAIFD